MPPPAACSPPCCSQAPEPQGPCPLGPWQNGALLTGFSGVGLRAASVCENFVREASAVSCWSLLG
jgi:hypothetical protein